MKTRRRFWKTGWTLVVLGLAIVVGFWGYLVPVVEGMTPDYFPHLSAQGFWEKKERALKLGVWRHDDSGSVGYCGGKEWVEKIVGWLRKGKEIESCSAGHRDGALPAITNHEVPRGEAYSTEWQRWWAANQGLTQEEWIRQGFAENGITVAWPPAKADWPSLLVVLGAAAGPSPRRHRSVEMRYAHHLRYNAYRWLRDSGFDPLSLTEIGGEENLNVEQQAGWRAYLEFERGGHAPPPPGRLAFAPVDDWDPWGRGPRSTTWLLKPIWQVAVTGAALLMVVGGLALVGLRVRVSFVRPMV